MVGDAVAQLGSQVLPSVASRLRLARPRRDLGREH
jgi:hypothetical protein